MVSADDPVDLPGSAEGAGEEDAAQVDDDGGREQVGRPVVDLADDQAGAHVEAEPEGGLEGLGHVQAAGGARNGRGRRRRRWLAWKKNVR